MSLIVLLRGGGDLSSGVALRLYRAGIRVIIIELPRPLVVRRLVSFAEAIYQNPFSVEGVTALHVDNLDSAFAAFEQDQIPILVDPFGETLATLQTRFSPQTPIVLIDGRMIKRPPEPGFNLSAASLVIGLGPGFIAGKNCHVVIETNRGHHLGRLIWSGAPQSDTGIPERVLAHSADRILRAPTDGVIQTHASIGAHLEADQLVADVAGQPVRAPFRGVLRGLLHSGIQVNQGLKIGDVDPRDNPSYCTQVSDKSLAIGGSTLEAILSRPELRPFLWD